jgi:hypothetical protein
MKKLITFLFLLTITFPLVAQPAQAVKKEPTDTIMLISGRKVVAQVQAVTANRVSYIPFEQKEVKEMDRKQVHKIFYRNGRVEHFNTLALQMVDEDNWQTVIITDKKDDVEGFFALGQIDAQSSPQARNARAAQRSADIRLKKKAVNMGGIVIFITKRESRGGYGEIPTHYVEGIVYGFEPPLE